MPALAVPAAGDQRQVRTRERVPLQWAMTQNNLGNALMVLGPGESAGSHAFRSKNFGLECGEKKTSISIVVVSVGIRGGF